MTRVWLISCEHTVSQTNHADERIHGQLFGIFWGFHCRCSPVTLTKKCSWYRCDCPVTFNLGQLETVSGRLGDISVDWIFAQVFFFPDATRLSRSYEVSCSESTPLQINVDGLVGNCQKINCWISDTIATPYITLLFHGNKLLLYTAFNPQATSCLPCCNPCCNTVLQQAFTFALHFSVPGIFYPGSDLGRDHTILERSRDILRRSQAIP